MQPATEATPHFSASNWWDTLFYVEKRHVLIEIGEPQVYYDKKFRDLPEPIQLKIIKHMQDLEIGEFYYRGGWKPGDYAIYSDFGLRSMFIIEILWWPESIPEQIERQPWTGELQWRDISERREGTVRAKIVDTTLVDWESPERELSPWRQVGTIHYYNYTNLYRNIYDLARNEAGTIYPSVLEKEMRGIRAHPGWEMLKKYGLVTEEEEEKAKEKAKMTLWERAMNLLQKHKIRDKATYEEVNYIISMLPMGTDQDIKNQIRKDLNTYPLFDAVAMWVQPVEGALSAYEPALFNVAKAMIEKYEYQYKLSTTDTVMELLPLTVAEFEDKLNQLTRHDLYELHGQLYSQFDTSPSWDTGGTKSTNIRSFTYWVKGHKDRIDAVLELVDKKLAEKAQYPVSGPVPGTKYISWKEFTALPSYPLIANAVSFRHDYRRQCSPVTKDGYVSVDAIYNMSAWANWKSSSLGESERRIANEIDNLHLYDLMKLNKGRRMNQPALFPEGLLPAVVTYEPQTGKILTCHFCDFPIKIEKAGDIVECGNCKVQYRVIAVPVPEKFQEKDKPNIELGIIPVKFPKGYEWPKKFYEAMTEADITIRTEVTDVYKGQINSEIIASDRNNNVVGVLQYQELGDEVLIAWIQVRPEYRRKGIATKLYQALLRECPEKKIEWGMTTDEGTMLRKSIEEKLAATIPRFYKNKEYIGVRVDYPYRHLPVDDPYKVKSIYIKQFTGRPYNVYEYSEYHEFSEPKWHDLVEQLKADAKKYNMDVVDERGYAYLVPKWEHKKKEYLPQTGTCYQDAWRFVIKEGEGTLVHGSVWSGPADTGKRVNHAWAETETGFIYEPESGDFFRQGDWLYRAAPIETARYSPAEAAIMLTKSNNYGPWTAEERKEFLQRFTSEFQPKVIPINQDDLRKLDLGFDTKEGFWLEYLEDAYDLYKANYIGLHDLDRVKNSFFNVLYNFPKGTRQSLAMIRHPEGQWVVYQNVYTEAGKWQPAVEFLTSTTSDYWNANLEYNALRSPPGGRGPDTDAGAFLGWHLEAAGDIIREMDKGEYADYNYIFEKFNRLRDHLTGRDWTDPLSGREVEALEKIREDIMGMPTDPNVPALQTIKTILLAIAGRRPEAIEAELPTLRQQLQGTKKPKGVQQQISLGGPYSPMGADIFPLNVSAEQFENVWKPDGWKLLIIGPTSTWREDWGSWEAIRDIVQNCLDETESYESGYDNWGLWIADQGKGVAIADFLLGPPKRKPDWARGKFGEGMKIACLAMVRARYSVHVETKGREMWIVFYEQSTGNGTAETLAALWRPQNGQSRWGTKIQFVGYNGNDFKNRFYTNLPPEATIFKSLSTVNKPMARWNAIIEYAFPEEPQSTGWFASTSISGNRIYARDIYLRMVSSPYSYNLWSFAMAPDRHAPASEEDMWVDVGRTWACVADVDLLNIFFQMVTRPPKLETDESYNLSMDMVKLGHAYLDIMKENSDAWQIAFQNVNGDNAVLRTSDRWDTTVRHLGYEPVSVNYWVENALSQFLRTDRNLIDDSQERLRDVDIVPDKKLKDYEMAHLELAREIAKQESGPRAVKGVWAAIIPPASDRVRTAGLYGTTTREIFINLPQFMHARYVVDTVIHELAHHRSDGAEDGTEEHLRWVSQIAGEVVKMTSQGMFDEILQNPAFVW
jgi:GNAT superfamily N-acetyltransferase